MATKTGFGAVWKKNRKLVNFRCVTVHFFSKQVFFNNTSSLCISIKNKKQSSLPWKFDKRKVKMCWWKSIISRKYGLKYSVMCDFLVMFGFHKYMYIRYDLWIFNSIINCLIFAPLKNLRKPFLCVSGATLTLCWSHITITRSAKNIFKARAFQKFALDISNEFKQEQTWSNMSGRGARFNFPSWNYGYTLGPPTQATGGNYTQFVVGQPAVGVPVGVVPGAIPTGGATQVNISHENSTHPICL